MGVYSVSGYISSFHAGSRSRVFVPVRPAQAVFAQYRHVSGVSASLGQKSVPLSRLQILDSLLSNLQSVSTVKSESSSGAAGRENPSEAVVEKYASKLYNAVNSVPAAFGTLGGSSSAGMVFSLTA